MPHAVLGVEHACLAMTEPLPRADMIYEFPTLG